MPALVNLGDTEVLTVVRAVVLGLLPPGIEVIQAFSNRVPEPVGHDFVVLTPLRRERISTNRDTDFDLRVIGSITDETMVVTVGPPLLPGYTLYGPAVVPGGVITAAGPDPGVYTVAPPQRVPAGSVIYVGRHAMLQPADFVYQCDVHGPASSRNVAAIHTTWRDDAGCELVRAAAGPFEMQPLYADDPHMVAFINAESQWEDRWIVDLHLQVNTIVTLGQEFADELAILNLVPVDQMLIPHPTPHEPRVARTAPAHRVQTRRYP